MKREDLKEIKLLTKRFEDEFKHFELKQFTDFDGNLIYNRFQDYLKNGAESIFTLDKPKNFKPTKWLRNPRQPMIWLSTEINPNGITGKNDMGRTYTIDFVFRCDTREKFKKTWCNDSEYLKFYSYGRTIDEIINEFKLFTQKYKFTDLF